MKYLILSPIALSLFIVPHLGESKEVEKIYFWVGDSTKKIVGKDMHKLPDWEKMECVADFHEVLNTHSKDDLIIFIDDIGMGQTGKYLTEQGWNVIGGKPITDRIEDDRQFACDLMGRIMNVPESTSFTSWEEAITFVKSFAEEERLVFKPNDADAGKEYTYVSKDIKDMLEAMKKFKGEWKYKEDFQIQQFVKGTEVDFSGYFNGKDYLPNSMMVYFENKPFMSGDIGPATGGAIAVEFAHKLEGVFGDILNKLKPMLIKEKYKGQLAINCIISDDDKKPYFLEFCGRVGYPSFPLDITLLEESGHTLHQLFSALVNGEMKTLFDTGRIGATVSVFSPPAPNAKENPDIKGEPISWSSKWYRYFYPYYVYYEKGMALTGCDSWVLQVTCADTTLDGAVAMLYDTYMPTLSLKNACYRNDLGKSAKERIKKVKDAGLL